MSGEGDRGEVASALSDARRARASGRLKSAVAALDRGVPMIPPGDTNAARALADEGAKVGAALEERKAPLAALSEHLRALDLAPDLASAAAGVERAVALYPSWLPPVGPVAPGNQLNVGATG